MALWSSLNGPDGSNDQVAGFRLTLEATRCACGCHRRGQGGSHSPMSEIQPQLTEEESGGESSERSISLGYCCLAEQPTIWISWT